MEQDIQLDPVSVFSTLLSPTDDPLVPVVPPSLVSSIPEIPQLPTLELSTSLPELPQLQNIDSPISESPQLTTTLACSISEVVETQPSTSQATQTSSSSPESPLTSQLPLISSSVSPVLSELQAIQEKSESDGNIDDKNVKNNGEDNESVMEIIDLTNTADDEISQTDSPIASTSKCMYSSVIVNRSRTKKKSAGSKVKNKTEDDSCVIVTDLLPNDLNPKILWVNNVNKNTSASQLKRLLSKYGKVIGAKIVFNPRYSSSCYGYVIMDSTRDADMVIEKLNNTEFNGQIIKISIYGDDRDETSANKSNTDVTKNQTEQANHKEEDNTDSPICIDSDDDEPDITNNIQGRINSIIKHSDDAGQASRSIDDTDNKYCRPSDGGEKSRTSDTNSVEYCRPTNDRGETSRAVDTNNFEYRRKNDGERARSIDDSKSPSLERQRFSNQPTSSRNCHNVDILTFDKIKEERERQKLREQERALREDNRRRDQSNSHLNEIRQQLQEERQQLQIQKEQFELQKIELLKLKCDTIASDVKTTNLNKYIASTVTTYTQAVSTNDYDNYEESSRFNRNRHWEHSSYADKRGFRYHPYYCGNNRSRNIPRGNYRNGARRYGGRYYGNQTNSNFYYDDQYWN